MYVLHLCTVQYVSAVKWKKVENCREQEAVKKKIEGMHIIIVTKFLEQNHTQWEKEREHFLRDKKTGLLAYLLFYYETKRNRNEKKKSL